MKTYLIAEVFFALPVSTFSQERSTREQNKLFKQFKKVQKAEELPKKRIWQ